MDIDRRKSGNRKHTALAVPLLLIMMALGVSAIFSGRAGAAPKTTGGAAPLTGNGKIAFTAERDGNNEIYTMDNNGANQTRITNNAASDNTPSWSPDGTKILFQSDRSGNNDIWVMNANGSGLVQLTTDAGSDRHPTWSPDGTQIAFVSNRDGDNEIFKMDANGANQVQLTVNTITDDQPDWSPDGTKIALSRTVAAGNNEIFTINTDGSGSTNITNTAGNDNDPDWSHDGTKIVFDTSRDGNFEVYTMNANGSSQTRLTNQAGDDAQPAWAPDGTKIAFFSARDGNREIYSMNANGSSQTRLTNQAADDDLPDWQDSAPTTATPTRTNTAGPSPTLTPCAGGTTFLNRSITASDTPLPNRISQNGVASSCATNKPFPGSIATTSKHYDQYILTNNSVNSQCVTITLTGGSCGTNKAVMSGAYLGSFDPNNLSQNYLGDLGQSVNAGIPQGVYSVNIPAFQQIVIVVYDIGTVAGCDNYTLRVDACLSGPGPSPTPVVTNTPTVTATPTTFPCPIVDTHVGALEATDPSFAQRMVASNASTCPVPVAFPGLSAFAGPFFYDTYTYVNTSGSAQCIAVTLTSPTCRVRVSAYSGSFNPSDLSQNYLATGGGDTQAGPVNMQVSVPAGGTVVFVVNEFNSSGALCAAYTIDVRSCGTLGTPTAIPTSTPTRTNTPTRTRTSTSTPTATPTNTHTNTPLPTQTTGGPTATPIPTNTNTPIPTNTPTRTVTNTATTAPTNTPTRTPTRTNTPLPTQTSGGFTATPVPTNTTAPPTNTPTATPTSTATTGQVTATATACTIEFSDVQQGSTFYTYIKCLACRGIINGYWDGTFRPANNVTRGQLSKIVANAAGFNEPHNTQTFEDILTTDTFYIFIERMSSRGIIGGYPCGGVGEPCVAPENRPYFRPSNNATRGQISKTVSNAAGYNDDPGDQIFEDVPPGSTFYDFIQRLANRGIMGGYPCGGVGEPCIDPNYYPYFRPANNASRGQTSKIVSGTFFPECVSKARP